MTSYIMSLYTITELKIMAIAGFLWAIFQKAIGGIDEPITALMCLVTADFITGVIAAGKTKTWSSKYGFKGILKKATMFGVVAFMFCLDLAMQTHMLRGMAISGFAIIEAISIIENIDRMGYSGWIPNSIRERLDQIRSEKKV